MESLKLRVLRALDWARTHKALVFGWASAALSIAQHVWPEFPAADVAEYVKSLLGM